MSILKIIAETSDLDYMNGFVSVNGTFISTDRVANGWGISPFQGIGMSWPEPVGNTIWIHFVYGQSGNSTAWDTTAFNGYDIDGNQCFRLDITDALTRWYLEADTSPNVGVSTGVNIPYVVDLEITKNGTTDMTMRVYFNGVLQGTVTAANSLDKGLPVAWLGKSDDTTNAATYYVSEMIIADEDTRGWRLRQHKPTAWGTDQDWPGTADAIVDTSLETGIVTNTLNDRASFGISNQPVPVGVVVDRVVLQTYAQRGPSGLASFNHYFKYAGAPPTDVDDADIALSANLDMYIDEYPTSPNTGLAWTDTELNDIQFGVRART
jgi:hypothetical protein